MTDRDDLAELKRQDDRNVCTCGAVSHDVFDCERCGEPTCPECGDKNEGTCDACYCDLMNERSNQGEGQ